MEYPLLKEKKTIRSPNWFPSSLSPSGVIKVAPPSARFSILFENAAFDEDYVVTDEPAFRKEIIYSTCNGNDRELPDFSGASTFPENGRISAFGAEELMKKCSINDCHGTLDSPGTHSTSLQENVKSSENADTLRKRRFGDRIMDPDASTAKENAMIKLDESTSDHAGEIMEDCSFGLQTSCPGAHSQENVIAKLDWNASTDAEELVAEKQYKKLPLSSKNLIVLLHHALRNGLKFSLRGTALKDVLTQPVRSARFFLTSSKSTELFNYKEASSCPIKERNTDRSKQKRSIQSPSLHDESVKEKEASSESDVSANNSVVYELDESNMCRQVFPAKSKQGLNTDDISPKTTLEELYCRGLGTDSSEDVTVQHHSDLSTDTWRFARSLYQNQEDGVNVKGNLPTTSQEFGDNKNLGDYTTRMNQTSPMPLVESMSLRDFPTTCGSMGRIAPLECKQKTMPSFPHVQKNQFPSEHEEYIMLPKSSMASWPSSESHCCFFRHVPHSPQIWNKNSLSKEPNEWPKSIIPCHSCHEHFHCSTSICQFQHDSSRKSYLCQSPAHCEYFQNPSEVFHKPASSAYQQHTPKCGGQTLNIRPKKLLWVSEEEAEIIRLIRLSQDISRCSSSYNASEQDSPISSAKAGPEIPEDINFGDARDTPHFSSRFSSSSVEDFGVKRMEDGTHSMCDIDVKSTLRGGDEESASIKSLPTCDSQINVEKRAASCIQHYWRKGLKRKEEESKERKRLEALKFVSDMPAGHDCLMQMAITAIRSGNLVRWYSSLHMAAKVIQSVWRETLKRRHEEMIALQSIPWGMKKLYEFIVRRQKSKGRTVPTYEIFTRSMERLQAVIEGARIRRRLKSRRLQTIVKEIKEIRLLVQEISNEPASEPFPNLLPQLSIQLQQKMVQLQTALSGPQDAARVLLRRCPATPLFIGSSKNIQEGSSALSSPKLINAENSGNLFLKSSVENFSNSQKKRQLPIQSTNINIGEKGTIGRHEPVPDVDLKAPLSSSQQVPPREESSRKQLVARKDRNLEERKEKIPKQHHIAISPLTINSKSPSKNNVIRKTEQVIQLWQKDSNLSHDIPLEEARSLIVDDSDYEDMSQNQDVPKHPFLRRKSKAMPPQKLDWSKVKPMVSSRLEPELKTRLFKPNFRGAASFRKKRNFSDIKSRLFNYEKTATEEAAELVKNSEFKHDGDSTVAAQRKLVTDYDSKEGQVSTNKSLNMQNSKQPSLRYFNQNHQLAKEGFVKLQQPEPQYSFPVIALEKMEKQHEECPYFPPAPLHEEKASICGYAENERAYKSAVEMASSELEKMFNSVVKQKDGKANSLANFFSSNQQDSIVPRLQASSSLFKLTRPEMSRIHKLLSKEGCAGRVQHKCLSFVSIRD